MTFLAALFPLYFFGNIHCFGMCGPLVMTIGRHRYRGLYFLGRIASFTLAGWFSGSFGFVLQLFFKSYPVGAFLSLLFGGTLLLGGLSYFLPMPPLLPKAVEKRFHKLSHSLSFLILKDQPLATFLFGFFTLLLPCGQTLILFSASALSGSSSLGALNGFLFALFTSPSLYLAMRLTSFFKGAKKLSDQIVGLSALAIGVLAVLRGLAELNILPHLTLVESWHLILY